jgi:hypothetical protein
MLCRRYDRSESTLDKSCELVRQDVPDCADIALEAMSLAKRARDGEAPAIAEFWKFDNDEIELIEHWNDQLSRYTSWHIGADWPFDNDFRSQRSKHIERNDELRSGFSGLLSVGIAPSVFNDLSGAIDERHRRPP